MFVMYLQGHERAYTIKSSHNRIGCLLLKRGSNSIQL